MIFEEKMTLANGVQIPVLGLGTWLIENPYAAEAVRQAVKVGYRHFDSAQAYGNEAGVGEGLRTCGIKREEIFLTSKVLAETKSYAEAKASIDVSLEKLGTYIDLMLIHCPQPWDDFRGPKRYFEENRAVWRALEEAYADGKVRAIGVSNFFRDDIENIWTECTVKPMVNQFSVSAGNTDLPLIDFCKANGIAVEAYSPIAHGRALTNEKLFPFAEKYGVSVPQLCVKYTLQMGLISLPKTANPEHMAQNAQLDFKISDEDMEALKALKR